jgi:hypothetical protein
MKDKNTQMVLQNITGPLNDFFKKLLSKEGEQWLSAFKRFLRKENPWQIKNVGKKTRSDVFCVQVNYDLQLEVAIKDSEYTCKSDGIIDNKFPSKRSGSAKIDIRLVHFGKNISSKDVLKKIDKMGLRPAEFLELLALGAKHPNEQGEYPIVALGSVAQDSGGGRVPLIWCSQHCRNLNSGYFESDWCAGYRFAVVSK